MRLSKFTIQKLAKTLNFVFYVERTVYTQGKKYDKHIQYI